MLIYYVIFSTFAILALIEKYIPSKSKDFLFAIITIFLILFVGLRGANVTRDYENYVNSYNQIEFLTFTNQEPAYLLLASFVKATFNDVRYLFLIYAALAIPLKIYSIKLFAKELSFLSLTAYYTTSLFLHEMTQMRAAIAISIFLINIQNIYQKKLGSFLLLVLIATLFHYSALMMLPFYFINNEKLNISKYLTFLAASILIAFFGLSTSFLGVLSLGGITANLIRSIIDYQNGLIAINIFNIGILLNTIICITLIIKNKTVAKSTPYAILMIKFYAFSIIAYYILINFGIANRVSEFLGIVQIFIIPYLVYLIKPQKLCTILVVLLLLSFLLLNIYNNQLIKPYQTSI